jgi:hypothetical protein
VQTAANRLWIRLVGLRYDIQCWVPDVRPIPNPYTRPYSAIDSSEGWIAEVLDPVRKLYFPELKLFMPAGNYKGQSYASLCGLWETKPEGADGDKKDGGGEGGKKGEGPGGAYSTLYEVSVLRNPSVVHVFRVIEYGRRFYRHMIFSSDAALSLHSFEQKELATLHDRTRFVSGTTNETSPPGFSMVITRNLYSSVGLQTFIPHRLLTGLLPSAILDAYDFWQNEDDSLIGYPKRREEGAPKEYGQTVVKVDLS